VIENLRKEVSTFFSELGSSTTEVGPAFNMIVGELVSIGRQVEYTCQERTRGYDKKYRHKRAYEIGTILDSAYGMKLMLAAAHCMRSDEGLVPGNGRDLERCWNGIGDWRGWRGV